MNRNTQSARSARSARTPRWPWQWVGGFFPGVAALVLAIAPAIGLANAALAATILIERFDEPDRNGPAAELRSLRDAAPGWRASAEPPPAGFSVARDPAAHYNGLLAIERDPDSGPWKLSRDFDAIDSQSGTPVAELRFQIRTDATSNVNRFRVGFDSGGHSVGAIVHESGAFPAWAVEVPTRSDAEPIRAPLHWTPDALAGSNGPSGAPQPGHWVQLQLTVDLVGRWIDARALDRRGRAIAVLAEKLPLADDVSSVDALTVESFDSSPFGARVSVDSIRLRARSWADVASAGGMDVGSESAPNVPRGWRVRQHAAFTGGLDQVSIDPIEPSSGLAAVRMERRRGQGPLQLEATLPTPVSPRTRYRLAFRYRVDEVEGGRPNFASVRLLFLDAQGAELGSARGLSASRTRAGPSWYSTELDFVTPEDAHFVRVRLHHNHVEEGRGRAFFGVISIDDLTLTRIPRARLDLPASSIAFVFGDRIGEMPEGFVNVNLEQMYREGDSNSFGWVLERPQPKLPSGRVYSRVSSSPEIVVHYPTWLRASGVRATKFRAPVADGTYRASVFMGGFARVPIRSWNHVGTVNGVQVVDRGAVPFDVRMRRYFRHVVSLGTGGAVFDGDGDWVHEQYVADHFERHDVDVPIRDGLLQLESVEGFMNAIVLTPIDEAVAHDKAMLEWSDAMREDFVAAWAREKATRRERRARDGAFQPTPDAPYVVFRKPWMRSVDHATRPSEEDLVTALAVAGAPAESEPLTFSIWPRRPLRDVRIEVTELVGPDAHRIDSSAIQVWALAEAPVRGSLPASDYQLDTSFLADWDVEEAYGAGGDEPDRAVGGRDLQPGRVQRIWLGVSIPEDARAGEYHGSVTIRPAADEAHATTLPLTLRVHPFRLVRPEGLYSLRRAGNQIIVPYPSSYTRDGGGGASAYDAIGRGDAGRGTRELLQKAALEDLFAHGFQPELSLWWPAIFDRKKKTIRWDHEGSVVGSVRDVVQLFRDASRGRDEGLFVDGSPVLEHVLDAFDSEVTQKRWTREDCGAWLAALYRDLGPSSSESFGGHSRIYLHVTAEESKWMNNASRWRGWLDYLQFVRMGDPQHGIDPRVWGNSPARPALNRLLTVHTLNTEEGHEQIVPTGLVDFPMLGMFHGVGETDQLPRHAAQQVADAKRGAAISSGGYGLYGLRGRFTTGYYMWASGASGGFHEFYAPFYGQPANSWDADLSIMSRGVVKRVLNEDPGWTIATYSPEGRMLSSWFWEELGEGRDDHAYLATLEHWIARAEGQEGQRAADLSEVSEAKKEAVGLIASLRSEIALDLEADSFVHERTGLALYRPVSVEWFDEKRVRIAASIQRLSRALGSTGAEAPQP